MFAINSLKWIKIIKVVFVNHKVWDILCKISRTSNQYRFYEAGGAPQWTDTACALLSHLTYRDRRRGPRPTRPLGKRGLRQRSSLTAPMYVRYQIGCLRGQQNLPYIGSVTPGDACQSGAENAIRSAITIYRAYESQLQINTSELLLLAIYTRGSLYI